jgi:hypothetical protein
VVWIYLFTYKGINGDKKSKLYDYFLKISCLFCILMNTILLYPLLNSFIYVITCKSGQKLYADLECFQGFFFLHLALGIFAIIQMAVYVLMVSLFFFDYNPYSKLSVAWPISKMSLYRNIVKIFTVAYVCLDPEVLNIYSSIDPFKFAFINPRVMEL